MECFLAKGDKMNLKGLKYFVIFGICLFVLCSCTKNKDKEAPYITQEQYKDDQDNEVKSSIEQDMNFLTSDACSGRRPGTTGNEKAAEYIAKRFKENGLAPLNNNFAISYTNETEILKEKKINLQILEDEKVIDTLIYGEDYREIFLEDTNLSLPLLEKPGDIDCAVLSENITETQEYLNNSKVKLILRKEENSSRGGYFYSAGTTPQLTIIPESYKKLIKYIGKEVNFSVDVDIENTEQNNITGIIKGKDSSNAIVISAHYDHVGSVGDNIWRGALDNTSGICTLLVVANELKTLYRDEVPPYDIIFCAFNSEENGLIGSRRFVEVMNEKYSNYFNINLDCLGNKDYTALYIHKNNSEASDVISDDLIRALQLVDVGPIVKDHNEYSSDQESFKHGIVLTTISDIANSKIHTLEDTPDKIDIDYLYAVGNKLGGYIAHGLDMEKIFRLIQQEENVVSKNNDPFPSIPEMTISEFEDNFNCKLNFADDRLNSIRIASVRPLLQDVNTSIDIKSKTLQDIRSINLSLDMNKNFLGVDTVISINSYKKDDDFELEAREYTLNNSGYNEKIISEPITIKDSQYYILDEKDNTSLQMKTIYENDEYYIDVFVIISGFSRRGEELTKEEKVDRVKEKLPFQYMEGMMELLFP